MTAKRKIERREVRHPSLQLEHSFLFRMPPRVAWPVVIMLLCAVALVESVAPAQIWFGPVYLAVIALAAWALSTRIAVAIGIAVIAIKVATGTVPYYPDDTNLQILSLAGRIVGILIVVVFIGMARKSCEREWRVARTDPLTGALNRQAFFEIAESDQCSGGWSALVYADLDGLKQLNDEKGHAQGDKSLKAFADIVRKTIRKGDVFARMGGDEFVIFMKVKDEAAGSAVASRLHDAINNGGPGSLKCSLGILVLPNGLNSVDADLRAADALMYMAKQSGSGVVVLSSAEIKGDLGLHVPASTVRTTDRDSAVRQSDRISAGATLPPDDGHPGSQSCTAA
ncbi:GGDEF domain-containing protein [Novosphingobium mangrovi (ex Huang et al. 2023)]|uniref:diguanylate cyclase n=1 Tax=Novosphingobium mangrovi (ex Huang et al. 2023) TaxID=2976432 RepID=A0ABT2I5D8_9SPHN|nr:GGDEF domain-containing protein [Novosphingobium mangrovi (ex Huang et al. 2023)]MCT2400015.1 GGDEF domain-containing protein [Novosphingobium mangrovi (ex Huang et al. 2023)]